MKGFLPDPTRISQVHLRTRNLDRVLTFYSGVLGLRVREQIGLQASLSAVESGPGLLAFTEDPNAVQQPPKATGLHHFAIRYPARSDLAHACLRLMKHGCPIAGSSDHGVSEAIYFNDPDGNGVELYTDRPRDQWPRLNGQVVMTTGALDLNSLLSTVSHESAPEPLPAQTAIGHIHLHVADLCAAERFYSQSLGLTLTQRSYPGALFFAAGGYHHHIGASVCSGKAAPPPNAVGLVSYRFEVPVAEILYCLGHRAPLLGYETRPAPGGEASPVLQIRDPNGHWLEVQAAPNASPLGANSCCSLEYKEEEICTDLHPKE